MKLNFTHFKTSLQSRFLLTRILNEKLTIRMKREIFGDTYIEYQIATY